MHLRNKQSTEHLQNSARDINVTNNQTEHTQNSARAPIDNRYTFKYSEGITLVK